MSSRGSSIPDAELDVLKVLWREQRGTVRELLACCEGHEHWAYTTLQTLLQRLEKRGLVSVDRTSKAHVFRPALTREELLASHLDDLAERVCGGERTPLVLQLVTGARFDARDIQRFRETLDELDRRRPDSQTEDPAEPETR